MDTEIKLDDIAKALISVKLAIINDVIARKDSEETPNFEALHQECIIIVKMFCQGIDEDRIEELLEASGEELAEMMDHVSDNVSKLENRIRICQIIKEDFEYQYKLISEQGVAGVLDTQSLKSIDTILPQ